MESRCNMRRVVGSLLASFFHSNIKYLNAYKFGHLILPILTTENNVFNFKVIVSLLIACDKPTFKTTHSSLYLQLLDITSVLFIRHFNISYDAYLSHCVNTIVVFSVFNIMLVLYVGFWFY